MELNKKPKITPGVVYLSYIPPFMNVTKVRELLSEFGEVGRIFLQPGKSPKPGKPSKQFTEGWVEFKNKKVAKRVALSLNGNQVGGRRRTPYYDSLWSIKYLRNFRWTHLNEQKALQKATREQRMRTEISQVKREANFYQRAFARSKFLNKSKLKTAADCGEESSDFEASVSGINSAQSIANDERQAEKILQNKNALFSLVFGDNDRNEDAQN